MPLLSHFTSRFKTIALLAALLTLASHIYGLSFMTNTIAVGNGSYCVVAADVNSDGSPDLICANEMGNTVTVLTNNGSGSFNLDATLNASAPKGLAIANLFGNGRADLVFADDNGLEVFTNNGTGAFGSNATLRVINSEPSWVTAADVNNDGKLDLISGNMGLSSTLLVWTNNGNGGFGSNATLSVGSSPECVVAADIRNNGQMDLISANYGANTLTVFTNNGGGIFGSNATLKVSSGPEYVVATDVNGDGKLDLVCAGSSAVTVFTNNGSGIFTSNAILNASGPLAVADINGDGKPDIICGNGGNSLEIFTNNGYGGFVLNTILAAGVSPCSLAATDINDDGRTDLICANFGASPEYIGTLTVLTQVLVGPPELSLKANLASLVLSWSSFSTGFTIETNSNVQTTNWAPAGYAISVSNGTNQSATLATPPGNLFFRLMQ